MDGSIEFITGEQREIWYSEIKLKGTVKPEKSLNEGYKKRFIKYVGKVKFLMSCEVHFSLRKRRDET